MQLMRGASDFDGDLFCSCSPTWLPPPAPCLLALPTAPLPHVRTHARTQSTTDVIEEVSTMVVVETESVSVYVMETSVAEGATAEIEATKTSVAAAKVSLPPSLPHPAPPTQRAPRAFAAFPGRSVVV